jgi:hypothetical protein
MSCLFQWYNPLVSKRHEQYLLSYNNFAELNWHKPLVLRWADRALSQSKLRATSYMRLRAHDHFISSTLIGGKGGAGPSSLLHTTLEGPTEYVNARWMQSLHGFLHGIKWNMYHDHLDYFQKPFFGGRPNPKLGDHDTPNAHNRWSVLIYHVWRPAWTNIHWNSIWLRSRPHMTSHYTWGSMTTLHNFGGVLDGLWTLSFGLSQFHGHGSWLVCEVALA